MAMEPMELAQKHFPAHEPLHDTVIVEIGAPKRFEFDKGGFVAHTITIPPATELPWTGGNPVCRELFDRRKTAPDWRAAGLSNGHKEEKASLQHEDHLLGGVTANRIKTHYSQENLPLRAVTLALYRITGCKRQRKRWQLGTRQHGTYATLMPTPTGVSIRSQP
jgi:hypothetical protein